MKVFAYTRFSTDRQGESSTAAQLRICRDYATRNEMSIAAEFSDEDVSSGVPMAHRPRGGSMLKVFTRGDVLLVAHTDRISRSEDLAPMITRLRRDGVRVIGVQEGFDSDNKQVARVQAMVTGLVGSEFRAATSDKTREALRLAFEQGFHIGGRAYGYVSVTTDVQYKPGQFRKRLKVNDAEAPIVLRIFEQYADGMSPRAIAARFNAEGIPSPGTNWRRTVRRTDSKWLGSAVLAILENVLYTGLVRYGASYSHTLERSDTGSRRFITPQSAAMERQDEAFRIIDQALWERVKARQAGESKLASAERIQGGTRKNRPGAGPPRKYLLSGLLKCAACGANLVMANKERYMCASHLNGGNHACGVSLSLLRERVERCILECVETTLFDPAKVAALEARYRAANSGTAIDYRPRIQELDREVARMVEAIAGGLLSDALAARLRAAEAERATLKDIAGRGKASVVKGPKASPERRRALLLERLAQGGDMARSVVTELFPDGIRMSPHESGRYFVADFGTDIAEILYPEERAAAVRAEFEDVVEPKSLNSNESVILVAGVGFEPTTFGL